MDILFMYIKKYRILSKVILFDHFYINDKEKNSNSIRS